MQQFMELMKLIAVIAATAWLAASLYAGQQLQAKQRGLEACQASQIIVPYQILKGVK